MPEEVPTSPIEAETSFTSEADAAVERSDSGYATSDIDTSDTDSLASNTLDDRYTTVRTLLKSDAGEKQVLQSITVETILSDKCGWGSLISGGQRAVDSLGQCLLVAASDHAENTRLSKSKAEYTLRSGSLKKNLEHCSTLGRSALRDVEKRMGDIKRTIRSANEENIRINNVIDQVENGEIDEGHLPSQLTGLLQISADTVEHADKMKEKVSTWAQYVADVRTACEQKLRRLNRIQKGKMAVVEEPENVVGEQEKREEVEQLAATVAEEKEVEEVERTGEATGSAIAEEKQVEEVERSEEIADSTEETQVENKDIKEPVEATIENEKSEDVEKSQEAGTEEKIEEPLKSTTSEERVDNVEVPEKVDTPAESAEEETPSPTEETPAAAPTEGVSVEEDAGERVAGGTSDEIIQEEATAVVTHTSAAIEEVKSHNSHVRTKFDSVLLLGTSSEEVLSSARDALAPATNFFSGNLGLSLHTTVHPLPPTEKKRQLRQSFSIHTLQNPSVTVYEFMKDVEIGIHDIKKTLEEANADPASGANKTEKIAVLSKQLRVVRDACGAAPRYMRSEMVEAVESIKETITLLVSTGKEIQAIHPINNENYERFDKLRSAFCSHVESIGKSVSTFKAARKGKARVEPEITTRPRSKSEVRNEKVQLYLSILEARKAELAGEEESGERYAEELKALEQELLSLGPDGIALEQTITVLSHFSSNLEDFQKQIGDLGLVFRSLQSAVDTLICEAEINAANSSSEDSELPPRHKRIEDIRIAILKIIAYYRVIDEAIAAYTSLSTRYIMPGVITIGGYKSSMSKDKPDLNFSSVASNLETHHYPLTISKARRILDAFHKLRFDRLDQEIADLSTILNTKRFVSSLQLRRAPSHASLDNFDDDDQDLQGDDLLVDEHDVEEFWVPGEVLSKPRTRFGDGRRIEKAAMRGPEKLARAKIEGYRHRHSSKGKDVVVG